MDVKQTLKVLKGGFPITRELFGKGFPIPLDISASLTATVTGSGTTATTSPGTTSRVRSGTTATSTAKLATLAWGFRPGAVSNGFSWNVPFSLWCCLSRENSDAQSTARFHLRKENSVADLGDVGVGITIANYAISGETYGSQRATVDLSTTMADYTDYWIEVRHDPDNQATHFYVNGVYKASITTNSNVPTSASNATHYWVWSIANGAAGGVNAGLYFGNPFVLMKAR